MTRLSQGILSLIILLGIVALYSHTHKRRLKGAKRKKHKKRGGGDDGDDGYDDYDDYGDDDNGGTPWVVYLGLGLVGVAVVVAVIVISGDGTDAVDPGAGPVDPGAGAVDPGAGAVDPGGHVDPGAGAVDPGAGAVDSFERSNKKTTRPGAATRGAGSTGPPGPVDNTAVIGVDAPGVIFSLIPSYSNIDGVTSDDAWGDLTTAMNRYAIITSRTQITSPTQMWKKCYDSTDDNFCTTCPRSSATCLNDWRLTIAERQECSRTNSCVCDVGQKNFQDECGNHELTLVLASNAGGYTFGGVAVGKWGNDADECINKATDEVCETMINYGMKAVGKDENAMATGPTGSPGGRIACVSMCESDNCVAAIPTAIPTASSETAVPADWTSTRALTLGEQVGAWPTKVTAADWMVNNCNLACKYCPESGKGLCSNKAGCSSDFLFQLNSQGNTGFIKQDPSIRGKKDPIQYTPITYQYPNGWPDWGDLMFSDSIHKSLGDGGSCGNTIYGKGSATNICGSGTDIGTDIGENIKMEVWYPVPVTSGS
jgi:hypothetical protein